MLKIRPVLKGYLFSLVATLAMANVYIFSKAALTEVNLVQFGFFWFSFAMFWNLLYGAVSGKFRMWRALPGRCYRMLILIGLLEVLGTTAFFSAINTVENPSIVSFLANLTPLFVTLLGVVFLKERFNLIEGMGIFLTFAGAFIISYRGGQTLAGFFIEGTGLILISSAFFSIALILAKRSISNLHPAILSLSRTIHLFLFSFIIMIATGQSFVVGYRSLTNMLMGSLLGPFLAVISQYSAIQFIEASRASIIQSTRSLFVLAGAFIYFGIFPLFYQVVGGVISIVGVVLISTGKTLHQKMASRRNHP